jgi:phosphohistidine phosphatase
MPDGKILYLVRHAESNGPGSAQLDFDRRLNKLGEHDAQIMGRRLKTRSVQPDVIISSPARRASQTSEFIATELGIPVDSISFDENIYEASVSNLIESIQTLDDLHGSAILIGHNPGISWLINQLTSEHIANAPTCSIATIRFSSKRWNDIRTCPAELLDFDYPKNPSAAKHPVFHRENS